MSKDSAMAIRTDSGTGHAATARSEASTGILLGIGAYGLWGLLPSYLRLLEGVPTGQVLAHRVLWSALLLVGLAVAFRRVRTIAAAARGRTLAMLCGSAVLIAANWLIYLWAVQRGHVLETSLGYYINPLVTVALGVAVLGERMNRRQAAAIGLAGLGVLAMLVAGGGAIWISLTVALTFAGYSLIRKVTPIDALGGLLVETLLLAPPTLVYLWFATRDGGGAFGHDLRLDLLLVSAGLVTSAPLLMFAASARRLPLTTVGLLQYIAPSLQLLQAVLLFGEPLRPIHGVTFAFIWAGLAVYVADALTRRRAAAAAPLPE